jgi:ferredoxin, 2Fe-2S
MRPLITFKIKFENQIAEIRTYIGEYRSLMVLIRDKFYVEGFGECGGVGRCGTCLVKILSENRLAEDNRNEKSTLEKKGIFESNIRLACQIDINENLIGAFFEVYQD